MGATGKEASRARRILWTRIGLAAALSAAAALLLGLDPPWIVEGGPRFFAPDRHRPLQANIHVGLWWAALVNALLLLGLLLAVPWWTPEAPRPRAPRWARPRWLLLATIVLIGIGLRLPLASKSLWWDEGWTVRQVIVGMYLGPEDAPAERRWRPGGLRRALWYAKKPTNHALYSVAAWGTNGVWRATHPGPPHRFSELAYRTPALLASALALVLVALTTRQLGFARAAPWAALLLAVHPWAIRYGAEGRAYSFLMAFSLLAAWSLLRWLRGFRDRDLALFATSQLLLLWTWSYSAFLCLCLGVAALVSLARQGPSGAPRWGLARRFVVANLLAGMAVLQVFAPNLTVAHLWDYTGDVIRLLPATWAGLTTGMLWGIGAEPAGVPDLARIVAGSPFAATLVFAGIPLLLIGGARAVSRSDAPSRAVTLGWLAAAPLSILATLLLGRHYYPRFQLFVLPLLVVLAAVGLERLGVAGTKRFGRAGQAAPVLLVAAWLSLLAPQLHLLLTRPYSPLRDVAEVLAAEPDALVAGLGFGAGMVKIYAPGLRYVDDVADLERVCREARAEGRPLLAFFGMPSHNGSRRAAIATLEDPAHFEPVTERNGIEPSFRYRVFRARPDACATPHAEAQSRARPRAEAVSSSG